MATMRYNFFSQTLSLCVDVTITYPSRKFSYAQEPKTERILTANADQVLRPGMKLQTVYVLHGGSDDDTLVHRYTNLERYAEENCVMTVTPQVKDSFFLDTDYGFNYYTFVTEELPSVMQSLFASSPRREDNFVIGMAMGGNAALMLAMKRPDLYSAAVDLSGGIGCSIDSDYFAREMREWTHIRRMISAFGDAVGGPWDLGDIARDNLVRGVEVPKLFLSVGEEDFIRDVVRKDRDALRRIGYQLHYEEVPGLGHEWEFWDQAMRKAFYEWLPLKRAAIYP